MSGLELSANHAWLNLISDVVHNGELVRPRGLLCKEILAKTSVVDMSRCVTTARPRIGYRWMAASAWHILTGRNDVASLAPHSSSISSFSNDGVRMDGAYGPRVVDQLRYVVDALWEDWQTRQAVIEIWRPNPRPSRDIPCTLAVQWMVRPRECDGETIYELHCFDYMRSSDAWLGIPYDWFDFSMLSAYVALMLRDRGRHYYDVGPLQLIALSSESAEVASKVQLGLLHLTAASQHIYVNPAQDGATNIPYSEQDVLDSLGSTEVPRSYEPLNLDEFKHSNELVQHLEALKYGRGLGTISWMREFCREPVA